MSKRVTLVLTPAQARLVNGALAFYEAEDHSDNEAGYSVEVMDRTRSLLWTAMQAAGVEP